MRLAALGAMAADEIFSESGYQTLSFCPRGHEVHSGGFLAIALRDAGQRRVHFRAFQHPTYAIHEQPMGWDDLIECQEKNVAAIPSLSFWAQAEQYCTRKRSLSAL